MYQPTTQFTNTSCFHCNFCHYCCCLGFFEEFALLLAKGPLQSHHEMLSETKTKSRPIKRLTLHLHVTIQEEWSGITMLLAKVDDAMQCTAVVTRCPLLSKVADIDNI